MATILYGPDQIALDAQAIKWPGAHVILAASEQEALAIARQDGVALDAKNSWLGVGVVSPHIGCMPPMTLEDPSEYHRAP